MSHRGGTGARVANGRGAGTLPELGTILTTHIAALRRYATALLGNTVEADDLVQDCLTQALSRAHLWDRVRDHRAYLFTILHNVHVDRIARQRRQGKHLPVEDFAGQLYCLPTQHVRLAVRDFERGLRSMPEAYRTVVLLVGLEGMSYRQTADVLGIPIGTVMSRLSRGREMLRQSMNGARNGSALSVEQRKVEA
jgi:RNA polymerase sigma-70 factor (ECF subfamily)